MKRKIKPDVRKDSGVKTMNKNIIKIDKCALYAPNRDRNFYNDYAENILLPEEIKPFKKHLKECAICRSQVAEAERIHRITRRSPGLIKIALERTFNQHLDKIFPRNSDDLAFDESVDMLPLAAAAFTENRMNTEGVAYGVAINKTTGRGTLLECIAVVSDEVKGRSKLEIRAKELRGLKRSGVEEKITTPTDYMEDILSDLFISYKVLLPLKLWEKTIRVEINEKSECGYIYEPDSAALAIMVAIVSAVTGKKISNNVLFSSGLKINGYLKGVGDIFPKIEIAKQYGMKTCITAKETKFSCTDENKRKSGIEFFYYDNLEDVLIKMGFIHEISPDIASPIKNSLAKYHPSPMDTSNIRLSKDIIKLTETLARNTHENWARLRIKEGWQYGQKRDDARKQHPCLLRYDDLPDEEKDFDRKTALEALKVIIAYGYKIEKQK